LEPPKEPIGSREQLGASLRTSASRKSVAVDHSDNAFIFPSLTLIGKKHSGWVSVPDCNAAVGQYLRVSWSRWRPTVWQDFAIRLFSIFRRPSRGRGHDRSTPAISAIGRGGLWHRQPWKCLVFRG